MISGPLDKLLPSLSKVTPGTLQKALSKDVVGSYEYGVPIDTHSLSEILIQVEGFNILKNKSIFKEMLGHLKKILSLLVRTKKQNYCLRSWVLIRKIF